jgi:SAM-dependent methyltransferase
MSAVRTVTAEFFDGIFEAYERSPVLPELMRSALDERLPTEVEPYSFITLNALTEIKARLRLAAGELLVDLACGRGGPGMWVARGAGGRLVGVDFSAVAVAQARARVEAFQLAGRAQFRVGQLQATGLAEAAADALMCVDAIQFAGDPALAVREVLRVLRPGGRAVFTTWEAREAGDRSVPEKLARLDLARLLRVAGFAEVRIAERPEWHRREHAVCRQVLATDPGDDPAVQQLRSEAGRILPLIPRLRRVIITGRRVPCGGRRHGIA